MPWLPHSWRQAATTELTGFHSAITWSQRGRPFSGTNALDRKMNGIDSSIVTEFTASGLRITRPSSAPSQHMVKPSSSSSAKPAAARRTPLCARQPISAPTTAITTQLSAVISRSETVRPSSTAKRDIGSERNRSTRPLCRSPATPAALVPIAENITWVKMPAMMYSR